MKITHINNLPVAVNKWNYQQNPGNSKEVKSEQSKLELPAFSKEMNVSFCAKLKRKSKKDDAEKITPQLDRNLPIFEPYAISLFEVIKELASKKICLVKYNDILDSKDIFIDNLRSTIDTNNLSILGLKRDIPFYRVNLLDYAESPENAFNDLSRDLNRFNKPSSRPILLIDGCRNTFTQMERPFDFINSSIFKKFPSIFFIEDGYTIIYKDDPKIMQLGFMSRDDRPKDDFFDERLFEQTRSKMSIINRFGHDIVYLPRTGNDEALAFLSNPVVQRELLGNGNDISISKKGIEFAIGIGKALAFNKGDLYNAIFNSQLLSGNTVALDETIAVLKRAVAYSLIKNPDENMIDEVTISESFPHDLDWSSVYRNYLSVLKVVNGIDDEENSTSQNNDEGEDISTRIDRIANSKTDENIKSEEGNKNENNINITFADIGGMYNIKKQLKEEFIDILKNPNIKNSQKPNGILLSGPPGCGKTLLAKAIAGETKVPFFSIAGSSFVEVYVGVGAKRVRELYAKAREAAQEHPSKTAIVFIDEVDAVAGSRKNGHVNSEDLRTVNALLHEMDGANSKSENDIKIITIVATNHEDMLDEAFKRSGRIDLKYTIDDPRYSTKAREEIIKIHSRDLEFRSDDEKNYLLSKLAKSTSGMSGADLAELLKKAGRMSMRTGRKENFVTEQDIAEAKMQVLAGVKTDIEHTEYELQQTVARTAGYAINAMVLEKIFEGEKNKHKVPSRVLDFITNSARGKSLGAVYYKPSAENKTKSKETCLADVIMLYGGYATESSLFDTHSSAVDEDLRTATNIIEDAVSNSDFGSEKHYLSLTTNLTKSLFAQEIKDDMKAFSKKGMEISKLIINFASPFIESYITDIIDRGEYDSTISADVFKNKFYEWLEKSGKNDEYTALCTNIKKMISEFCGEKERNRLKLGFNS